MPIVVNEATPHAYLVAGRLARPNPVGALRSTEFFETNLRDLSGRTFNILEEARRFVMNDRENAGASFTFPTTVEHVAIQGETRTLRRPLQGQITWRGDLVELEIPDLGILVSATNLTSLQTELFEELEVLIDKFLRAPDSELAPSGRDLKHKLQVMVGE